MTKDEVLKLALEALEEAWYHVGTFQPTEKAIDLYDEARTAIKEALAQPEQEYVGGPAFPFPAYEYSDGGFNPGQGGMTLREYAAINLKVPDSGDIDLDEMIRKSLRNDFAKACLQGYMVGLKPAQDIGPDMQDKIAGGLFSMAQAMLKAGEAV